MMLVSLTPRKGIDVAVEAMHELEAMHVDAELTIAGVPGKGHEAFAAKVRERSEHLKHNCVRWLGWVDDTKSLLAESDVMLLPSRTEGLGQCMAQGMAAGRPVVGSNVGGIPTLVQDGKTGLLFPAGDAKALADRLKRLAENRDEVRRMGQEARRFVLDVYNIEKHVPRLRDHLAHVARKRRKQTASTGDS